MSRDEGAPARAHSHSSLSCFEHCPRKYHYRYIEQVEVERRGIEAFSGTMVHLALQHLYQQADEGMVLDEEEIVSYLRARWEEGIDDSVVVVKKGTSREDYLLKAEEGLRAYHRRYHPFDHGSTVGLEQGVSFTVRGERDHTFVGYIDRLTCHGDGIYEIHDYKTGKRLPSLADLRQDRQLALYEIGVRQNYPEAKEVHLVWHFLSHDKELRSRRTAEELKALERRVGGLVDEIERCERFPCCTGPLCRWCEYFEMCQH